MDTTLYLLKNGKLYEPGDFTETPYSLKAARGKYDLVLDDSYFFYLSMGKLNINPKKARAVAVNFLRSRFPAELFAGFAMSEVKGEYILLIYNEAFAEILKENPVLFKMAARVSTVFCELSARYEGFSFTDGTRVYMKNGEELDLLAEIQENTLIAREVWDTVTPMKADVHFEGIKRETPYKKYIFPAAVLVVCYFCFLFAGVFDVLSLSKTEQNASKVLEDLYTKAGVLNTVNPQNELSKRAAEGNLAPFKIMAVLDNIGKSFSANISIETFNVSDTVVRFEGLTRNYADIEAFKNMLQTQTKKTVTIESSQEVEGTVRFTMRFEP